MKLPIHPERRSHISSRNLLRREHTEQQPNQLEILRASLKPYEQNIFELYQAHDLGDDELKEEILHASYLLQLFPEKKSELRQSLEPTMNHNVSDIMHYGDRQTAFHLAHLVQFFPEHREQLQRYVYREPLLNDARSVIDQYNNTASSFDTIYNNLVVWWSYRMLFLEQEDQPLRQQLLEKVTAHPEVAKAWDIHLLDMCKMILPEYDWKNLDQNPDFPDPKNQIWAPGKMPSLGPSQSLDRGQLLEFTLGLRRFYQHAILVADRVVIDHSGLHLQMEEKHATGHTPLPERSIV